MEEHKSVTVQVDKAAGKIYVDGVLPNATLCLYHIRGKVIEVKQARGGKYGFFILVAAFALAEVFYHSKTLCTYFEICFQTVMTPFIILVPVLLWMPGGRRRA